MPKPKYPLNDPRHHKVYQKVQSNEQLRAELKELLLQWQAEGKVKKDVSFAKLYASSTQFARIHDWWNQDQHRRKHPWTLMTEEERQVFREAVLAGDSNEQILAKCPKMKTENIIRLQIHEMGGRRTKLTGQKQPVPEKQKPQEEQKAKDPWTQFLSEGTTKEDQVNNKLIIALYKYLVEVRRVRNQQVAAILGLSKVAARGFLEKRVQEGMLVRCFDANEKCEWYLINQEGFYEPKELYEFVPDSERQRILEHIEDKPKVTSRLAHLLYGDEERGIAFLESLLKYFENLGLIELDKREGYALTERGVELGIDAQSIKTLGIKALEHELFVHEEEAGVLPESLDVVAEALQEDIKSKTVPVIDLTEELAGKDLKLLPIGEILYGSQYTDQALLKWILGSVADPTLVIASGLVQGRFEIKNKAKTKMLAKKRGLHKIEVQYHAAGMLLEWLERIATCRVCVIQGDDDFRLAEDYGSLMHLAEGKNPWKWGVDWSSFSAEMQRRLENEELREKIRIQWEIIRTYMFRIGRSLWNRAEVKAKIGVAKSEYRLIIEIMVAKRHETEYPKEYEKVVNVAALYGDIGKRIVSPDTLRLLVAKGKEIRIAHNAGFSSITQYAEPIQHLDALARHLGLSRQEVPWVLADFHQEAFFAEYLMGTWLMNFPGLQDTRAAAALTMKEWNTNILESKERRQSRVRKEPVSSAVPEIKFCADGRVRFRLLNHAVMKVLEEQKCEPEQHEVCVLATDLQFGSITNWPELTALFLDYALYARGASQLWMNGDIIHGSIYPQSNAENRPMRLTTLHAQQQFGFQLIAPLILDAPYLRNLIAWLGNHEWNNMSAKYQGDNPLTFLETGFQGIIMERKRAGIQSTLEKAMTVSRIRWMDTHNPQGDIVNWPFYSDTICGFKVALQHMWQPFCGQYPINEPRNWLKRMARAAKSIDILLGGHLHSVSLAQVGDKLLVQAGAGAGQSGFELARGLMSTVMFTLVEFSNRHGITVEFVPWEFLLNYRFQCPAYLGKDDQFVRPAEGTEAYEQGKMAPYIEGMIDRLTRYLPV